MKIHLIYIITIVLISANLAAQSSVHLSDKLSHKKHPQSSSQNHITTTNGTNSLTKTVFGFLPYWELYNENLTLRYDLLTHIALFDFLLENDGSISFPPEWENQLNKWSEIINDAKSSNVKVIMTISNLSLTDTDSLLVSNLINNQSAKNIFFSDVKTIISDFTFDGVNLDFENPKLSERGDPINNFVQEVRDSLDSWFTGKELSFATPAVNWGGMWKLNELSEICDYLFIMAYDYHGSWSTTSGPVAPLSGNGTYNLKNYETTINEDYEEVEPDKLILGVPYYGAEWLVDEYTPYVDVIPDGNENTNWVGNPSYADVRYVSNDYNYLTFDGISQTTYIQAPFDNDYKLIWIDTPPSLELKYDFAIDNNLSGIGIWSLGKDGSRNELWNLIEEKFADSTTSVEEDQVVNEFVLYQNYPNPFNPTTTIEFGLPESAKVALEIFNILGEKAASLVNKELEAGYHQVSFDGSNLSSGIYIYRIQTGNSVLTRKMLLMK